MDNKLSIDATGSMLLGAGLVQMADKLVVGLILIGVGVALKVLLAYLQKSGLPIEAPFTGSAKK